MKRILLILFVWLLILPGNMALADTSVTGGGGDGVNTTADCNVAAYYSLGKLCQDTDNGKLYKGTGAAVVEIGGVVDLTAPGPIGSVTPSTGKFTALQTTTATCQNAGYWAVVDATGNVTCSGTLTIPSTGTFDASALPAASAPIPFAVGTEAAPTGEGRAYWNSSTDKLTVGSGAAALEMVDTTSAQTLTNKTLTAPYMTIARVAGGPADLSLSAAQVSNTVISNTGQGPNNRNHTLPVAAAGMNFIGFVGEAQASNYFRFTANTSGTPDDFMCLDGTCGKLYVSIAAPTQGATMTCYTDQMASTGLASTPTLGIGTSANTAVKNTVAFAFDIAGTGYSKAISETAPGNDVIPQNKYGAVAFDIGANGTINAIEATDNATGYDSAALAIAGLPAAEAARVRIGNVTVVKTDGNFTFGTTALSDAATTVTYTNTTVYTKPYTWICHKSAGTWVTD